MPWVSIGLLHGASLLGDPFVGWLTKRTYPHFDTASAAFGSATIRNFISFHGSSGARGTAYDFVPFARAVAALSQRPGTRAENCLLVLAAST